MSEEGQVHECTVLTFSFLSTPNIAFHILSVVITLKGTLICHLIPASPWSFSHLESGTWFPSFLATRSGQMTVFWPIQHWQRSRGLPFVPFLSLCLKHVKCFWAMNMKTIQKMVKQKGEGSVYFWQLHGAADLHTYLSQCFWSRMYS